MLRRSVLLVVPRAEQQLVVKVAELLRSVYTPFLIRVNETQATSTGEDLLRDGAELGGELPNAAAAVILIQGASDTLHTVVMSLRARLPNLPVVLISDTPLDDPFLGGLELGVDEYVHLSTHEHDLLPRLQRLSSQCAATAAKRLRAVFGLRQLVGESQVFREVVTKLPVIARSEAAVLLTGETGTGKEVFARSIHYLSPRAAHGFIAVNCGAIPVDLIENELFGHEREAFTGAAGSQQGLVLEAEQGTLFLDEIDCMRPTAQVKLLRLIQEKEYRPLGSSRVRSANVRIIAASNADLADSIRHGKLRPDLFYRLNVLPLRLPPLRERPGDILILARHFLVKFSAQEGRKAPELSAAACQVLLRQKWPGNVRELEHVIARGVVFACGAPAIEARHLGLDSGEPAHQESFAESKKRAVADFERDYIERLLVAHNGNVTQAARTARKHRRALWALVRKHGIDLKRFREAVVTTQ